MPRDGQQLTPRCGGCKHARRSETLNTSRVAAHHTARRPAGRHRIPARGALRVGRGLGRCRLARRGCHRGRGGALPGASAVQVDADAHGGRYRAGDGRRRRGAERVHRQGAHLLLRARARQRSGAGGRPGRRRGAQRSMRRRRRRTGTRRRPRGDRDARRRPRGRAGRHVPDGVVRRSPGGASGDRHSGIGVGDDARPTALVSRAALHAGADGRRGGRQRRPRRGGRAGARALRVAFGPRAPPRRAAQGRRAGHRRSRVDAGQPGRRADPRVVGRAHTRARLGASLGAVGAAHRARRRLEFPAVPRGSRIPRAGLLGLLGAGHLRRQRRAVGVCGMPARAFRRSHAGDQRRARVGGARRHHRGRMPHRQGFVARRAGSGPGGFQLADEPHRSQRTELRHAPQHRAHLAANRRGHRRRGQRGGPPIAEQAPTAPPSSARITRNDRCHNNFGRW